MQCEGFILEDNKNNNSSNLLKDYFIQALYLPDVNYTIVHTILEKVNEGSVVK